MAGLRVMARQIAQLPARSSPRSFRRLVLAMLGPLIGQRDLPPELFGKHFRRNFRDAAAIEIAELEGSKSDADQAVDCKAQMLADLLHFAVLALADGDIEPDIVALRLVDPGLDRPVMHPIDGDPGIEPFE